MLAFLFSQFNNYQTVIVSDVLRTYVVFSYMCGGIQWSALGRNRAAVVGFNAKGINFGNHPSSGFSAVGNAVSCTFDLGKRRKRQDGDMPVGNMGMPLPADETVAAQIANCRLAVGADERLLFDPLVSISTLADMLGPCPCTRGQANLDRARYRQQADLPQCYHSVSSVEFTLFLSGVRTTLTQQCCYANNG